MKAFTVDMTKEKETKGTVKYESVKDDANVPTLYIRKAAFDGDDYPAKIKVSVATVNGK